MLPRYRVDDANKEVISKKKSNHKRKTTEQYKEELSIYNPNVEVLEEYINARTPILHKYPCGHINNVIPSNALKGLGCYICSKKKATPKWTTEKYKEELKSKNPEIELLEEYQGAKVKILHRHKSCGAEWKVVPLSVLRESGCPKCLGRNVTKEEFLEKFRKNGSSNIKITGEYVNITTKVEGYCIVCGNMIYKTPYELLKGVGCKKCADRKNGLNLRKTHKQFVSELKVINNNIKILGTYSTANSKIKVQCDVCNYIWKPVASSLLSGYGCPKCARTLSISHDEFIEKIKYKKNSNIEIIGTYIDSQTPIQCQCKICNHIFNTTPYCIEIGHGCKKCADKAHGIKLRKSKEDFLSQLQKINENIEVVGDYIKASSHIRVKCLKCGVVWNPIAYSLLQGCGCPNCNASKLESHTEKYLKTNNIQYIKYQKYNDLIGVGKRHLSYDFYIPQYNLLIECQGEQHERPVEYFGGIKKFVIQKIHDTRKRKYAHDNNINLLEIWYYEENKIDKLLTQTLNNLKSESVETVIPA